MSFEFRLRIVYQYFRPFINRPSLVYFKKEWHYRDEQGLSFSNSFADFMNTETVYISNSLPSSFSSVLSEIYD